VLIVPLWSSIGLSHKAAIRIDKLNKTDLSDKLKIYFIVAAFFLRLYSVTHTHTHTMFAIKQPSNVKQLFSSPSGHKIDVIQEINEFKFSKL
jgi:hypothetical protein